MSLCLNWRTWRMRLIMTNPLSFIFGNKRNIIATVFFFTLMQLPILTLPIFIGICIDMANAKLSISDFILPAAIMLGLNLVSVFGLYFYRMSLAKISRRTGERLRGQMCREALYFDFAKATRFSIGRLNSKYLTDIKTVEQFPREVIDDFLFATSFCIVSLITTAMWAPVLLLVTAILLPIVLWGNIKLQAKLDNINQLFRARYEWLTEKVTDYLNLSLFYSVHKTGQKILSKLLKNIHHVTTIGLEVDRRRSVLKVGLQTTTQVFELVIIVILAVLAARGHFTIGKMGTLIYYFSGIFSWLLWLISLAPELSETREALMSLQELNTSTEHDNDNNSIILPESGKLSIRQLSYAYPNSVGLALSKANFTIPKCTFAALVGPSGSGKTTIIRLLTGMILPDLGGITYDNILLNEKNINSFRMKIAWVPQEPKFFGASIKQNLVLGESINDKFVWECLKKAAADRFVKELPFGIHTKIGNGGRGLSTGQLQRLAIARALLRRPFILIMDEPTSALDPEMQHLLVKTIKEISKLQTTIIASHSVPLMLSADMIILLDEGKIIGADKPSQLLKDKRNTYLESALDLYEPVLNAHRNRI